jgi:hypothetical protein
MGAARVYIPLLERTYTTDLSSLPLSVFYAKDSAVSRGGVPCLFSLLPVRNFIFFPGGAYGIKRSAFWEIVNLAKGVMYEEWVRLPVSVISYFYGFPEKGSTTKVKENI